MEGVRPWGLTVAIVSIVVLLTPYLSLDVAADRDTIALERTDEWCVGCTDDLHQANVYEVVIADFSGDGAPEVVAVGDNLGQSQLSVFGWQSGVLTLLQRFEFGVDQSRLNGAVAGHFAGSGTLELVTIGISPNGGDHQAELRVWSWSLSQLVEVATGYQSWHDGPYTFPQDVAATPLSGGRQDVMVASHYRDPSGTIMSEISQWSWAAPPGAQRVRTTGSLPWEAYGLAVGDSDGDGIFNVVAGGRVPRPPPAQPPTYDGQLRLYTSLLGLLHTVSRPGGSGAGYSFNDLEILDVDLDPQIEVVATGGADWTEVSEYGEVTTWYQAVPSNTLQFKASGGNLPNRYYVDLAVGQVDSDSPLETIAVGTSQSPGAWQRAGLTVWQHSPATITVDFDNVGWTARTYLWSAATGDTDGDGMIEFVTAGLHIYSSTPDKAQLAIWNWNTPPSADEWTMFHRSALHDGVSPISGPLSPTPLWSKSLLSGGTYAHTSSSPVVAGGRVYTVVVCPEDPTGNRCIYSYDLLGNLSPGAWPVRFWFDLSWTGGPDSLAIMDGKVFYAGYAFQRPGMPAPHTTLLGAVDAINGTRLWEEPLSNQTPTTQAPTATGGAVWIGVRASPGTATQVYAYDTQGNRTLSFETGAGLPDEMRSSIAVWRDRAFVRTTTKVYAIPTSDPNGNGQIANPDEIIWEFDLGVCPSSGCVGQSSPTIAFPAALNGAYVLIGTYGTVDYPSFPGGRVFAIPAGVAPADKIIDRTDPAEVAWVSPQLGDYVASTPAATSSRVYVGADLHFSDPDPVNSYLYALDASTGQAIWPAPVEFQGGAESSSPAVATGNSVVYFVATITRGEGGEGNWQYLNAFSASGSLLWRQLIFEHPLSFNWAGCSPALASGKVFVGNGANLWQSSSNANPFIFGFG